jgi:hypothetical protein
MRRTSITTSRFKGCIDKLAVCILGRTERKVTAEPWRTAAATASDFGQTALTAFQAVNKECAKAVKIGKKKKKHVQL